MIISDPISINGEGSNNWNWAVSQPWCYGSGTSEDPYIIENLIIDASESNFCIEIKNSYRFFHIRNCILQNAVFAGIALNSVLNGTIFNNTIYDIWNDGINVVNGPFNYIKENNIYNNHNGIWWVHSCLSNITNNLISNNEIGINISWCNDINVYDNIITTGGNAIWQGWTNYSIYSGNQLVNNDNSGFHIELSHFSKISNNLISYHQWYGILLSLTTQNRIFDNQFIENGINARDDGTDNQWDYNNIGNYWSDYLGSDANDDGIGDTPYNITGSAGSQDNYPIWDDRPG